MNILIFGASGGTGQQLLTQGIALHHHITAFVRNPAKITITDKNLSVIQGNILQPKDVENAIKGQEVVISTLGNKTSDAIWKANTTISDGVNAIISGMKQNRVKRLLFVASFGINDEIFLPEKIFIRVFLKNIFADIPRQEKLIKESQLDWTIVHPARLINGVKTEQYQIGEHLPIGLFSKISRADVADFLLKNLTTKISFRKTLTISY